MSGLLRFPSPSVVSYCTDLSSARHTRISIEKRQKLINVISRRILETVHEGDSAASAGRDELFGGDLDADDHPLSILAMEAYLRSYWDNFHPQLPILHEPTFNPDNTHDYMVLAVLVVGASLLGRNNPSQSVQENAANFAEFVARNLRWHVLMHPDSNPPGSLWVIQALLLLEWYEKLNSTRTLHERAHIYYPTTLNLMRRCSTLFGRQFMAASHAPSVAASPKLSHGRQASNANTADIGQSFSAAAPELWWENWIAREAMRRAALSAFLMDAAHAVMFGHSPTLVIHEIQMQLPCDNILWSSGSSSEIGTVESCLYAHGVRPASFLSALKKILNSQQVRTNAFGRIILMAGLLSVSCQMHQRDLYGTYLGGETPLGFQDKWQPKLIKAFDWWLKDFTGRMDMVEGAFDWQKSWFRKESGRDHTDSFLPLGKVLYHLGHMTIHISAPELCVYAGATQILGRIVSVSENKKVRAKIRTWAASPETANDVYHALKLIKFVLFSPDKPMEHDDNVESPNISIDLPDDDTPLYDASCDTLLNRPWVLYLATLLVWAYGFALDGRLVPFPSHLRYPPSIHATPLEPIPILRPTDNSPADTTGLNPQAVINPEFDSSDQRWLGSDTAALKRARYRDLRLYLDTILPHSIRSSKDLQLHLQRPQQNLPAQLNGVVGLLGVVDDALAGSRWELLDEARGRLQHASLMLKGSS